METQTGLIGFPLDDPSIVSDIESRTRKGASYRPNEGNLSVIAGNGKSSRYRESSPEAGFPDAMDAMEGMDAMETQAKRKKFKTTNQQYREKEVTVWEKFQTNFGHTFQVLPISFVHENVVYLVGPLKTTGILIEPNWCVIKVKANNGFKKGSPVTHDIEYCSVSGSKTPMPMEVFRTPPRFCFYQDSVYIFYEKRFPIPGDDHRALQVVRIQLIGSKELKTSLPMLTIPPLGKGPRLEGQPNQLFESGLNGGFFNILLSPTKMAKFDLRNQKWIPVGNELGNVNRGIDLIQDLPEQDCPTGLFGGGSIIYNDKLCVIDPRTYKVHLLDLQTHEWKSYPTTGWTVFKHLAVRTARFFDGKIYMINPELYLHFWSLDLSTLKWKEIRAVGEKPWGYPDIPACSIFEGYFLAFGIKSNFGVVEEIAEDGNRVFLLDNAEIKAINLIEPQKLVQSNTGNALSKVQGPFDVKFILKHQNSPQQVVNYEGRRYAWAEKSFFWREIFDANPTQPTFQIPIVSNHQLTAFRKIADYTEERLDLKDIDPMVLFELFKFAEIFKMAELSKIALMKIEMDSNDFKRYPDYLRTFKDLEKKNPQEMNPFFKEMKKDILKKGLEKLPYRDFKSSMNFALMTKDIGMPITQLQGLMTDVRKAYEYLTHVMQHQQESPLQKALIDISIKYIKERKMVGLVDLEQAEFITICFMKGVFDVREYYQTPEACKKYLRAFGALSANHAEHRKGLLKEIGTNVLDFFRQRRISHEEIAEYYVYCFRAPIDIYVLGELETEIAKGFKDPIACLHYYLAVYPMTTDRGEKNLDNFLTEVIDEATATLIHDVKEGTTDFSELEKYYSFKHSPEFFQRNMGYFKNMVNYD